MNIDRVMVRLARLEIQVAESDRRYEERNTANLKAVDAAFAASREAILEAKKGQDAYNLTHNDLVRKMERQSSEMISRVDTELRFKAQDDKIGEVRTLAVSVKADMLAALALSQGSKAVKDESRANIALAVSLIVALMALFGLWSARQAALQPSVFVTNPSALQPTTPVPPLPGK